MIINQDPLKIADSEGSPTRLSLREIQHQAAAELYVSVSRDGVNATLGVVLDREDMISLVQRLQAIYDQTAP